jgi:hypothetical protein
MSSNLSQDLINQITPLLGSIARLVGKFGTVSESQLSLLFETEDFPNPQDILGELSRWAQLLEKVYENPSLEIRATVIESLRHRGIDEAPVILAVSEVADAVQQVKTEDKVTWQLGSSTTHIDFGALPLGETAEYEFEVYGGPGYVSVHNTSIEVIPDKFDLEPTTLRVRIKPPVNDEMVFHDHLILRNEFGEQQEISLTVQWQEGAVVDDDEITDDSTTPDLEPDSDIITDKPGILEKSSYVPWIVGCAGFSILVCIMLVLISPNIIQGIIDIPDSVIATENTEFIIGGINTEIPFTEEFITTPTLKPDREIVSNSPTTKTQSPSKEPSPSPTKKCPGAPKKRVSVDDQATICTKSETVYLRTKPSSSADYTHRLVPGADITVIGGPKCDKQKSWWYWKVRTESGYVGWVSEGGDTKDPYFICPK